MTTLNQKRSAFIVFKHPKISKNAIKPPFYLDKRYYIHNYILICDKVNRNLSHFVIFFFEVRILNSKSVNNRLKELRIDKDIKQYQIAEVLGISQNTYSQIENGIRGLSFEMAIKIANFYNVPIDYLVGEINYNNYVKQKLAQYGLIAPDATDEELDKVLKSFKRLNELQKILRDMGKL